MGIFPTVSVRSTTPRLADALAHRGCVVTDVRMPEMTGMDLHRELSRVAPEQAARMIFLTGGAFTPAGRLFLSATSREHIEKPFDPANLRAIVRRHLG